ncbi:MAG TPA: prolyl oligopeptidase family serine peptidase [Yinghuangia sp.]|nr:prolyl oligopeptidase family serine peptidase [Yinghuangia sp.]
MRKVIARVLSDAMPTRCWAANWNGCGLTDKYNAAQRLWLGLWGTQRHVAEVVRDAERFAEEHLEETRKIGLPPDTADTVRASAFALHVQNHQLNLSAVRSFLKFREAIPVLLEAETRAYAGYGHARKRLGPPEADRRAHQAMVDYALDHGIPPDLLQELLNRRFERGLTQAVRTLKPPDPVPANKFEAAAAAARAFDEAVGNDALADEFRFVARAQSRYAERRPPIRAGDVEVFVRRQPDRPERQIVARHGDGPEVVLVQAHAPNIVFPRVYPDGFWLEPTHGRYFVYSSQASGNESGAGLTVLDTRSGDVLATIPGAEYPDVSWETPETFVWVGAAGEMQAAWRFDVATGRKQLLVSTNDFGPYVPPPSTFERRVFYRSVAASGKTPAGAEHPWMVVGSNRGPHGSANRLTLYDTSLAHPRAVELLGYSDETLGSPQVTADNRLIVVGWSEQHPRGRIAEVPLDFDRKRIPPNEWRDLVPDDGETVIRDVVAADRGPGREPLFVVSRTRHGAAEVQVFDVETGRGTPVPLHGLGLPEVCAPDGTRLPGLFGQITGMTVNAADDGTNMLEIEHSSIVSPPRSFRFQLSPTGVCPAGEIRIESTIADKLLTGARTTRHTFTAPDGTLVRGWLVEHADAPGQGPLMFTSYSNYFVGNNTSKLFNHVHSTHFAAGGRLWINDGRGTGSDGYQHYKDGALENQFAAVMDVVAGADHVIANGIAAPGDIHASAQSSGPMVMLRAVAQRAKAFASATLRRPDHDPWQVLITEPAVAAEFDATASVLMSSRHYLDPGMDMPELTIVIGAPDDPRIDSRSAHELAWQLMTTLTKPLLHLARPGRGHFAGEQEAAEELSATWRTFDHPLPSELRPGLLTKPRDATRPVNRLSAATARAVRAAAAGLSAIAQLAQQGKHAPALPESAPANTRAHASHLAQTTPHPAPKSPPKYADVHLAARLGGSNRTTA